MKFIEHTHAPRHQARGRYFPDPTPEVECNCCEIQYVECYAQPPVGDVGLNCSYFRVDCAVCGWRDTALTEHVAFQRAIEHVCK